MNGEKKDRRKIDILLALTESKNVDIMDPKTDARPIYSVAENKKKSKSVTPFTLLLQFVTEDIWGVLVFMTSNNNASHLSTRRHCQEGEEFPR